MLLFDHRTFLRKNTLVRLRQRNSYLVGFTNDFGTFLTQSLCALDLGSKLECQCNLELHVPWHFLI